MLQHLKGWSTWLSNKSVVEFGSGGVNFFSEKKIFEGVELSQSYEWEWWCNVPKMTYNHLLECTVSNSVGNTTN